MTAVESTCDVLSGEEWGTGRDLQTLPQTGSTHHRHRGEREAALLRHAREFLLVAVSFLLLQDFSHRHVEIYVCELSQVSAGDTCPFPPKKLVIFLFI